jgi:hypothetical protein
VIPAVKPDSCRALAAPALTKRHELLVAVGGHRSPSLAGAVTRGRREIRGVGGENLTGGNTTRTLHRSTRLTGSKAGGVTIASHPF